MSETKSPSYVSKNATYYNEDFFPVDSKTKKTIPVTRQAYLARDTDFTKGTIKQVYDKRALFRATKAATAKGLKAARSVTGKEFDQRDVISILVSPKRFKSLISHTYQMKAFQGAGKMENDELVQAMYPKFKNGEYFDVFSNPEQAKEKYPSHYGKYAWRKKNFLLMYDLIRQGKVTTQKQIEDIDFAFEQLYYGYKNPRTLIMRVLKGEIKMDQVENLRSIRSWIYKATHKTTGQTKIEKFLENKVLRGELTKDMYKKLVKMVKNKNMMKSETYNRVGLAKTLFHRK